MSTALDQEIAVFGESGSGKTVLLSSFYGAAQEKSFLKNSKYRVVPEDPGQGSQLHENYLGMRNRAEVPSANRFRQTTYRFKIQLKDQKGQTGKKIQGASFDHLRLIWHDYPGEWFESNVTSEEEGVRRIQTFKTLLGSDVALLLVDGQRLLDHKGEEGKYLRRLFTTYRNTVSLLQHDLTADGELEEFPRIWVIALSKADLLPEMDAYDLRDLVTLHAGSEVEALRQVIESIIAAPEALSVGQDFVILSSAEFEPDKIDFQKAIGLDLILPLSGVFPLGRHVEWAQNNKMRWKTVENLLSGVSAIVAFFAARRVKLPGRFQAAFSIAMPFLLEIVQEGSEKVSELHTKAAASGDHWKEILTGFRLIIENAERNDVLLQGQG